MSHERKCPCEKVADSSVTIVDQFKLFSYTQLCNNYTYRNQWPGIVIHFVWLPSVVVVGVVVVVVCAIPFGSHTTNSLLQSNSPFRFNRPRCWWFSMCVCARAERARKWLTTVDKIVLILVWLACFVNDSVAAKFSCFDRFSCGGSILRLSLLCVLRSSNITKASFIHFVWVYDFDFFFTFFFVCSFAILCLSLLLKWIKNNYISINWLILPSS